MAIIYKRIAIGMACLLAFSQAYAEPIETAAKHAYMIDATTGAVLLDKDGDTAMVPSSMSKLMTAYIVFSRLKEGRIKLEDQFTISEKAWAMQGSKSFVPIGGQISVEELIHGIVIQSGNDACIAAAEGISGSEEAFVKEMNETATKLGLTNSHFLNATGWPDEGHVMSAHDLAILSKRLITEFPEYYHYFSIKEYTFNNITQFNRNRLLGNSINVDGLKTGHTQAAGYGITLSAKVDDRRLILVINGLESDNQRVEEGDKILRWGFREFVNKTLVSAGKQVAEADVWFGEQDKVPLVAEHDVVVTLPASGASNAKYTLVYEGTIKAPIKKGTHIADLKVKLDGGSEQIIPLVASENAEKLSGFKHMVAVIKYYLAGKH